MHDNRQQDALPVEEIVVAAAEERPELHPEVRVMHPGLPAALPDHRTAARLLDELSRLERRVTVQRVASHQPHAVAPSPEMLALQRENTALKSRQAAARQRLEQLLVRVQALPDGLGDEAASPATPEGPAA